MNCLDVGAALRALAPHINGDRDFLSVTRGEIERQRAMI